MALSDSEVQSLRRHLGFGNVNVGAYPYTPDGFLEVFRDVIAPNLQTALETSASTGVLVVGVATVTLAAVTGITAYTRLVVDVGDDAEIVTVKSVLASTVTASFAKLHPASGYPVAIESGTATLRMLLHSADTAWQTLQSSKITKTAGLNSVGKGEVVWFPGGAVLKQTLDHYRSIAHEIGDLVRVQPRWETDGFAGGLSQLEAY